MCNKILHLSLRGILSFPKGRAEITFTRARGLPQSVIDAEDSEHYGDGMKIYTQPVPADQGQMDDISEGITNLGTAVTNNLHPEGMEKPYHGGENRGAEQNK